MRKLTYYNNFQQKALKIKIDFIDFLIKQKKLNKKVIGYGAAAKGNTLLNYCGIRNDFIDYVVDASLFKQNKFLPASHIPVVSEEYIKKHKPDYVVIFPWNLEKEITAQLSYIRKWNGKFVVTIPKLRIF